METIQGLQLLASCIKIYTRSKVFGEAWIGVSLFNHPFSLGLLKYLRYGDKY